MRFLLKNIGIRLRIFRKKQGLTLKQMAKKFNVSASAINEAELGNNKPSFELIYGLLHCYNIDVKWLLLDEKENNSLKIAEPGVQYYNEGIFKLTKKIKDLPQDKQKIVVQNLLQIIDTYKKM